MKDVKSILEMIDGIKDNSTELEKLIIKIQNESYNQALTDVKEKGKADIWITVDAARKCPGGKLPYGTGARINKKFISMLKKTNVEEVETVK